MWDNRNVRYHKSYKYRVWGGSSGIWYWQLVDFPANRIIDGKAESKREAAKQAKDFIDHCR